MKKVYIITGTSRGIGEALARQLMHPDHIVVCISRNKNPRLHVEAVAKGCQVHDYDLDLHDLDRLRAVMTQVFHLFHSNEVQSIALINNAGTVTPIRRIGSGDVSDKLRRNINVNLTSALLITETFVREVQAWPVSKRIVNMSSGAARRPYVGWSAYCVAKAGLEMLTQCVALEQEGMPHPIQCISFSPGVVDTEMQAEIRSSDPKEFAEHQRFLDLKAEGKLLTPAYVAQRLADLLASPRFGEQLSVDVRTLEA
jgi:benzil reductase ((S)-benzoin forming)